MIVGIEELIGIVRQLNLQNFEVRKDANDSNSTQLRTDGEKMTQDDKINLLRNVMQNNYGRFYLIGYETTSQTKYRHCLEFMIKEAGTTQQMAPQLTGFNGVPDGYMTRSEVETLLAKKDMENKVYNMEKEIAELKKEKKDLETPVNEFFRNLAPIASTVVSGLVHKQAPTAAVAGLDLPEDTTPDDVDENMKVAQHVEDLMQRWITADPQAIELFEKLVVLCETNRATYDMAKDMLNKMV